MVYNLIKNIALSLALAMTITGTCFAQNNLEGMRLLTVNTLMQYGQKLYDRGDFNQAWAVFEHILVIDAHQPEAMTYIKEMGRAPKPVYEPVSASKSAIVIRKSADQVVESINVSDTQALKAAIEAKKLRIKILQAQIKQMRSNIAAQTITE